MKKLEYKSFLQIGLFQEKEVQKTAPSTNLRASTGIIPAGTYYLYRRVPYACYHVLPPDTSVGTRSPIGSQPSVAPHPIVQTYKGNSNHSILSCHECYFCLLLGDSSLPASSHPSSHNNDSKSNNRWKLLLLQDETNAALYTHARCRYRFIVICRSKVP